MPAPRPVPSRPWPRCLGAQGHHFAIWKQQRGARGGRRSLGQHLERQPESLRPGLGPCVRARPRCGVRGGSSRHLFAQLGRQQRQPQRGQHVTDEIAASAAASSTRINAALDRAVLERLNIGGPFGTRPGLEIRRRNRYIHDAPAVFTDCAAGSRVLVPRGQAVSAWRRNVGRRPRTWNGAAPTVETRPRPGPRPTRREPRGRTPDRAAPRPESPSLPVSFRQPESQLRSGPPIAACAAVSTWDYQELQLPSCTFGLGDVPARLRWHLFIAGKHSHTTRLKSSGIGVFRWTP